MLLWCLALACPFDRIKDLDEYDPLEKLRDEAKGQQKEYA